MDEFRWIVKQKRESESGYIQTVFCVFVRRRSYIIKIVTIAMLFVLLTTHPVFYVPMPAAANTPEMRDRANMRGISVCCCCCCCALIVLECMYMLIRGKGEVEMGRFLTLLCWQNWLGFKCKCLLMRSFASQFMFGPPYFNFWSRGASQYLQPAGTTHNTQKGVRLEYCSEMYIQGCEFEVCFVRVLW